MMNNTGDKMNAKSIKKEIEDSFLLHEKRITEFITEQVTSKAKGI